MEEFYLVVDGTKLHAKLDRPGQLERCPLVILLHGLTGHMEERHIVALQKAMNEVGCAVLRVELYGHGKSDGNFCDHTLYKWISETLAIIDYAKTLEWVTGLYLAGHSQGGYTTMLVAGMRPDDLEGIIPLSPAIIIEDAARDGSMFGMSFDPAHIPDQLFFGDPALAEKDPEVARRFSFNGNYFRVAQTLHANEAIDRYPGPVLLVHGRADEAVPVSYSIDAAARYANARLVILEDDNHGYSLHLDQATAAVQEFLRDTIASDRQQANTETTMRIVIPCETNELLDAPRSGHFGHAPWLTIVELDEQGAVTSVESVKNAEHGEGGCGNVIAHVIGLGADAIIAAGMGMPPLMRFTQAGMTVYADRSVATAGEVLQLFLAGKVARMSPDDACQH